MCSSDLLGQPAPHATARLHLAPAQNAKVFVQLGGSGALDAYEAVLWLSPQEASEPWTSDGIEASAKRYEGLGAVRFVEGVSWGRKRQASEPSGDQDGASAAIRSAGASAPGADAFACGYLPNYRQPPFRNRNSS